MNTRENITSRVMDALRSWDSVPAYDHHYRNMPHEVKSESRTKAIEQASGRWVGSPASTWISVIVDHRARRWWATTDLPYQIPEELWEFIQCFMRSRYQSYRGLWEMGVKRRDDNGSD